MRSTHVRETILGGASWTSAQDARNSPVFRHFLWVSFYPPENTAQISSNESYRFPKIEKISRFFFCTILIFGFYLMFFQLLGLHGGGLLFWLRIIFFFPLVKANLRFLFFYFISKVVSSHYTYSVSLDLSWWYFWGYEAYIAYLFFPENYLMCTWLYDVPSTPQTELTLHITKRLDVNLGYIYLCILDLYLFFWLNVCFFTGIF